MKLLFDANLSRRIIPALIDLFPGSTHVTQAGLPGDTPDEEIWNHAKRGELTIVTTDADFLRLAERLGFPPRIIRLERMDYPTDVAAELIRRYAIAISEFEKSNRAVMILRRK